MSSPETQDNTPGIRVEEVIDDRPEEVVGKAFVNVFYGVLRQIQDPHVTNQTRTQKAEQLSRMFLKDAAISVQGVPLRNPLDLPGVLRMNGFFLVARGFLSQPTTHNGVLLYIYGRAYKSVENLPNSMDIELPEAQSPSRESSSMKEKNYSQFSQTFLLVPVPSGTGTVFMISNCCLRVLV